MRRGVATPKTLKLPEKPIPNLEFAVAFGLLVFFGFCGTFRFFFRKINEKNLGARTTKLEPVKPVKNVEKNIEIRKKTVPNLKFAAVFGSFGLHPPFTSMSRDLDQKMEILGTFLVIFGFIYRKIS